jgi:hypothetical protein
MSRQSPPCCLQPRRMRFEEVAGCGTTRRRAEVLATVSRSFAEQFVLPPMGLCFRVHPGGAALLEVAQQAQSLVV